MLNIDIGQKHQIEDLIQPTHYPAANTNAVIVIASVANRKAVIHAIQWSYSAAPTGGRLVVTVGGVTVLDTDITSGGPGGFQATFAGDGAVITLYAGGAAIVGKLSAQYVSEA